MKTTPIKAPKKKSTPRKKKEVIKPGKYGIGTCSYAPCGKQFPKHRNGQKACSAKCKNRQWHVLNPKPELNIEEFK